MLSREENELITRVGQGTAMGNTMRRYWVPALLAHEIADLDGPPVRVRLLGEDLVAFRDTQGRIGLLDEYCPHRRASLFFGRSEERGVWFALRLSRLEVRCRRHLCRPAQ
jgi:phthalate 4,5-dioxygenase